jgi:hypothetical protein
MNMFKNLFAVGLMILGSCLYFTKVEDWKWVGALGSTVGPAVVNALLTMQAVQPFSTILCFVLALTLFMVRKQY